MVTMTRSPFWAGSHEPVFAYKTNEIEPEALRPLADPRALSEKYHEVQ